MPTNHIESFGDKKKKIVEELKGLKKEIEDYSTAQAMTDPEIAALTDAQKTEKVNKLNAKVAELKAKLEQDVVRWKETLGTDNAPALEAIDTFWQEMQEKIDGINKTEIGGLLTGLEELRQRVEAAETNTVAPDEDTTAEEIMEADKVPTVKDIIVEMEEEEQTGFAGMIAKFSKMAKPLMKILSGLMIEFKKISLSMNPFGSEASKQQARAELEKMQEAYESNYGTDDLRDLFTAQAKELGFEKLVFKPGLFDGKAVTSFNQKYLAYRDIDPSKTKEQYIKELLTEYVKDDAVVTETALAGEEHFITMKGFMEGKKPQVVA
ncbi:hypothetical protein KKF55_06250 [Patescibacteria group bacterium]|nr:hypothetical protein [Patescibacteria group bacterium]